MAGAWYVMRWILIGCGVLMALYASVWLGARLYVVIQRYRQKKRKIRLWHHYVMLQKKELEEPLTPQAIKAIQTLRHWPSGEEAYLMIHNIFWYRFCADQGKSPFEQRAIEATALFPLDAEPRKPKNASHKVTKQYLYVTNYRLILIQDNHEESLSFSRMDDFRLDIDTMEIYYNNKDRWILHGYHKPEMMVRLYQLMHHFWEKRVNVSKK